MTERQRAAQWKRLEVQLKKPENKECFDCTSKQPRWASTNLGIFMCLRCAGVHRSLGVHITKVKSTKMDLWEEEMIQRAERIGNGNGKELYECGMREPKPDADADTAIVERLCRQKYEQRRWYAPDFDARLARLLSAEAPPSSPPQSATTGSPSQLAPPVHHARAASDPQSMSRGASERDVEWGQFHASPVMPKHTAANSFESHTTSHQSHVARPSPGQGQGLPTSSGTGAGAPTKALSAAHDDFWTSAPRTAAPPSGPVEFGTFERANNNNGKPTPAVPCRADDSLMSFKPPTVASPAERASGVDDILAAFGTKGTSHHGGLSGGFGVQPSGHATGPGHHGRSSGGGFPF